MRKTLTFILSIACSIAYAQNTFPPTGNVGIGTLSPQYQLQMLGNHSNTTVNLRYNDPDPIRQADLTLWASEPGWTYTGTGIGNNIYNGISGITRINTLRGGSYIRLLDQEMKFNVVKLDGTDIPALTVASSGNIGIRTGDPGARLSFNNLNDGTNGPDGITWYSPSPLVYGIHRTPGTWVAPDYQQLRLSWDTGIILDPGGSYGKSYVDVQGAGLRITSGNVGIGTIDTKGYKLAVAGNIIAESVKVKLQGAWPDYVFAKDYQLPTLQETEKHIKDKGHLPGIPSAAEVKANGVDLGEMNAKLLQKIEELTLHLIEMNNRLGTVEKENALLKSQ